MNLDLKTLHKILAGSDSAIRSVVRLQPIGGEGHKCFPPTYLLGKEGGRYATERRRVGDEIVERAVLLDSVPSQANRIEEALQRAIDEERIKLPLLTVEIPPVGRVTSLEAPHRLADAIFRDSELNGASFRDSKEGQAFVAANVKNATALFELCPTALIFGTWDSQGAAGGPANKFARTLVSEVVGYHAELGTKTESRLDPLGIEAVKVLYNEKDRSDYTTEFDAGAKPPKGKKIATAASLNHSNIPPTTTIGEGGVTIAYAKQTVVLSLPGLRRLRFPLNGFTKPESETAARAALAALALAGITLQREQGFDFRSRCQLVPETTPAFELVGATAGDITKFDLSADDAIGLLNDAVDAARKAGLPWRDKPIELKPSGRLLKLVEASRKSGTAGE